MLEPLLIRHAYIWQGILVFFVTFKNYFADFHLNCVQREEEEEEWEEKINKRHPYGLKIFK